MMMIREYSILIIPSYLSCICNSCISICLFQVQRIPQYDKYLSDLLAETEEAHPDFEDLSKAATKVKNVSHISYFSFPLYLPITV